MVGRVVVPSGFHVGSDCSYVEVVGRVSSSYSTVCRAFFV